MANGGPNWLEKFWSIFMIGELGLGRVILGFIRGLLSLIVVVGMVIAAVLFFAMPMVDKLRPHLESILAYAILFVIFYIIVRSVFSRR